MYQSDKIHVPVHLVVCEQTYGQRQLLNNLGEVSQKTSD